MARTINTMADYMDWFYGRFGGGTGEIKKDAPFLTSSGTGYFNTKYGKKVYLNVNQDTNIVGVLKHVPYDGDGFRVKSLKATDSIPDGIAEGGNIPATLLPTLGALSATSKDHVTSYDISSIMARAAKYNDSPGNGDIMAWAREDIANEHMNVWNRWMGRSNATAISLRSYSVDHLISNDAESTAKSLTTEVDIYGQDRHSGATYLDANVQFTAAGLQDLTPGMMDKALTDAREALGFKLGPDVILTGPTGGDCITYLVQPQARYSPDMVTVSPSVNGVQVGVGTPGVDGAVRVNTYQGLPIIQSADITKDTNGASRIYFYNKDLMYLRILTPTMYFQAGVDFGTAHAINKLANEITFMSEFELLNVAPKGSSKIRDLNLVTA